MKDIWNFLTELEGRSAEEIIKRLSGVHWVKPLIAEINSSGGITKENMAKLFELRFAYALHQAGLPAEYEIAAEGQSSIDFGFHCRGVAWRVEMMRLEDSVAVRNATSTAEVEPGVTFSSRVLTSNAKDAKESPHGETLKAIQRICQKCEKAGVPHKFQDSDSVVNVLLVDLRNFMLGGDDEDMIHIALGGEALPEDFRQYWEGRLITGAFHPQTVMRGAHELRTRVHILGFVCERSFEEGELAAEIRLVANPLKFEDVHAFRSSIHCWPFQPAKVLYPKRWTAMWR